MPFRIRISRNEALVQEIIHLKKREHSSNCLSKGKYLIKPYLLFQAQLRTRIMILWLFFSLEGTWNFSEPKAMALGKDPVMAIAVVSDNLWCSCGNKLFIISHDEEVIKVCFLTDVFFFLRYHKKVHSVDLKSSYSFHTGPKIEENEHQ